ncbi:MULTISPECIES: cellulase family glycosylhydrolase [Paenibacillus]|uniref:cellulase family glycosylhydrolase n=1 Tax=Paenibacillus TaxID=44249 RepID=UPI0022B8720C|nr:cellulase family glycosylhydrolase [Paenibacillus caseinilyticus]MCZ8518541.1 cellulase family glycosylhydrolase [Paenibacillus caseinilyticus]
MKRIRAWGASLGTAAAVLGLLLPFGSGGQGYAAPSVPYGQLRVQGAELLSDTGQPVQLRGMSSHGMHWYGDLVNKMSLRWLKEDWGSNLFRVAMYTAEKGYITDPSVKEKVKEAVQEAIDLGLYVIIDWHILVDGDPNTYKTQAKAFFQEMASLYGQYPNVIYELCNEPNGDVTWGGHIKPYAQELTQAIRAIDPDNIIIVGTPNWSQDVNQAADNPLPYGNIMYAAHFYAGTHGQWLRDRIDYARSKGAAVFVTEWGTSDASGDGGPFLSQSQQWIDFMAARRISWANWSLADKEETSAALLPGANPAGGWPASQLTASGQFVRAKLREGLVSVPAAPSGLKAAAGSGQVALSWNAVTGASGYTVKRATVSGGPYSAVGTVTGTGYIDTGLANAATYYYVVSASNTAGSGPDSAPVSAQPAASPGGGGGGTGTLSVQYRAADTNASDNGIKPHFNIRNTGSAPVDLKGLKLRYYFTKDGSASLNFNVDWAQIGSSQVQGAFGSASAAGADTYLEVSFTGGSIPAGGQTGDIQIRINKGDWSSFNEAGDYSYDPSKTSYADWNQVTLYRDGTRVWGTEP